MTRFVRILLFLSLWCGVAFGQYTTTYQWTLTNLKSYAVGANNISAWKQVSGGGQCLANKLVSAYDGNLWCVGLDDYPWKWVYGSGWTKQTAMGAVIALAVVGDNEVYSLQTDSFCTPDYAVHHWNGTSWDGGNGCLTEVQAGGDGTLLGVNNGGTLWKWWNGGWASIGTGYSYAAVTGPHNACAVKSGAVYAVDVSSSTVLSLTQPSFSVKYCALTDDGQLYVTSTSGSTINTADLTSTSTGWQAVGNSIGALYLVGINDGQIFGEDTSGYLYHFNIVNVPLIQGTTSGTWNHCPLGPMNCPPNVYHRHSLQVTMPSGVSGVQYSSRLPSTQFFSGSSYDSTPSCDLVYGPDGDSACTPSVTGQDYCEASNEVLSSPGPPPAVRTSGAMISRYFTTYSGSATAGPAHQCEECGQTVWTATATCNQIAACLPGHTCTCTNTNPITVEGVGGSPSEAQSDAKDNCNLTDKYTMWVSFFNSNAQPPSSSCKLVQQSKSGFLSSGDCRDVPDPLGP